jgi:tRNA(fMet)-specific endonuclease VapC
MILDTNALSAFVAQDAALLRVIRHTPELTLPVIVLGEYRFGISQSRHRADYEAWLDRDLNLFSILSIVEETTRHYAAIRLELKRKGLPVPANDAWIAALARQHRLAIVSRDMHFDAVRDLERIDW